MNARVGTLPQRVQQLRRRLSKAGEFVESGREQIQKPDPSGQGLGHRLAQAEVLRPRQHEPPRRRIRVNHFLEIGRQFGHPLDLVDHRTVVVLAQEAAGVFASIGACVDAFQGHVRPVGKHHPAKRRLSRLPGAGDRDHWIVTHSLTQWIGQIPLNERHGPTPGMAGFSGRGRDTNCDAGCADCQT